MSVHRNPIGCRCNMFEDPGLAGPAVLLRTHGSHERVAVQKDVGQRGHKRPVVVLGRLPVTRFPEAEHPLYDADRITTEDAAAGRAGGTGMSCSSLARCCARRSPGNWLVDAAQLPRERANGRRLDAAHRFRSGGRFLAQALVQDAPQQDDLLGCGHRKAGALAIPRIE